MALQEDINFYQRRSTLYIVLFAVIGVFLVRLVQLQVLYYDEYGKKSDENSVRTIPREPVRGYLYDRNG
ncbi:hypothetical protein EG829_32495, partial [bacterium]|nr:hypothetical protein [bacterium]